MEMQMKQRKHHGMNFSGRREAFDDRAAAEFASDFSDVTEDDHDDDDVTSENGK